MGYLSKTGDALYSTASFVNRNIIDPSYKWAKKHKVITTAAITAVATAIIFSVVNSSIESSWKSLSDWGFRSVEFSAGINFSYNSLGGASNWQGSF